MPSSVLRAMRSRQSSLHQTARPDHVPLVALRVSRMVPEIHATIGGAWWWPCRARYLAVYAPRMLTDGEAGSRWSFIQHSPKVCLCASGAKHTGSGQKTHELHRRCARHLAQQSAAVATCWDWSKPQFLLSQRLEGKSADDAGLSRVGAAVHTKLSFHRSRRAAPCHTRRSAESTCTYSIRAGQ